MFYLFFWIILIYNVSKHRLTKNEFYRIIAYFYFYRQNCIAFYRLTHIGQNFKFICHFRYLYWHIRSKDEVLKGWTLRFYCRLIYYCILVLLYFVLITNMIMKNYRQDHFDGHLPRNLAKRHYSTCLSVRAESWIRRTISLRLFMRSNSHLLSLGALDFHAKRLLPHFPPCLGAQDFHAKRLPSHPSCLEAHDFSREMHEKCEKNCFLTNIWF